jgi:hypothetical protein
MPGCAAYWPTRVQHKSADMAQKAEHEGEDVIHLSPETSHEELPDKLLDSIPAAVPVPMSPLVRAYQGAAFALSAALSPYLVIPGGTLGIVASQSGSRRQLIIWSSLSVFFSTIVPALFVLIQVLRGKITDIHVMEREQRGGPFIVAIVSSAISAGILRYMDAPIPVWSTGLILAVNGIVMLWITTFWKISMHVSVLAATVFAAIVTIPGVTHWQLLLMIPALIWARVTRGRHSIWQGIGGAGVACIITAGVLYSIKLWPRVASLLEQIA